METVSMFPVSSLYNKSHMYHADMRVISISHLKANQQIFPKNVELFL